METFSIDSIIGKTGSASRASQLPTPPRPAGTVDAPSAPNNGEARNIERAREANSPAKSLEQTVRESVEKLNEFIRPYVTSLQFSVDEDLGRVVVKIMDGETKEIIKQIPSEDVLTLTKALGKVAGLLVRQEA